MEMLVLIAIFLGVILFLVGALLLDRKIRARYAMLPAAAKKALNSAIDARKKRERIFNAAVAALFVLGFFTARTQYFKEAGLIIICAVGFLALAGNILFALIQGKIIARHSSDPEISNLITYQSMLTIAVFIMLAGSAALVLVYILG